MAVVEEIVGASVSHHDENIRETSRTVIDYSREMVAMKAMKSMKAMKATKAGKPLILATGSMRAVLFSRSTCKGTVEGLSSVQPVTSRMKREALTLV